MHQCDKLLIKDNGEHNPVEGVGDNVLSVLNERQPFRNWSELPVFIFNRADEFIFAAYVEQYIGVVNIGSRLRVQKDAANVIFFWNSIFLGINNPHIGFSTEQKGRI